MKVEVKDNGAGFDVPLSRRVGALESEQFSINNVKNRLKIMENAELHVKSREGEGTTIIIIIPVKNPEEIP